ncbi:MULTISPECIES: peptidylprolyl isomerase [unclassified Adlercreutzia]|uniref:peptidylprolyl isomerase n=1 Tax=unclassified Adlercreutzia TaxID=2636013 RepID=UPI0013EC8D7D|nr:MULTISPECIES: peptidylprolyl isomerase [unclassified Adlercreutzia]
MKKMSFAKSLLAAGLAAACVWGLAGCAMESTSANGVKLTGGVAATVNGVEIAEDDVTIMIENQRAANSLDTEDAWGKYLAQSGSTPEKMRESFIDGFIGQELIRQFAEERGVTVDDAQVEEGFEKTRSNYADDEKWQEALKSKNLTEDTYRDNIRFSLLYQGVTDSFAVENPSDESMLTYGKMFSTSYNGAKKSSHILFEAGDEATAQQVLDEINAGTLDFAAAAQQYSKDSSAADGGNVGWDKLTTFVTEYQEALDGLEVNQVSGLVTTDYGIHIIKCTEVFTAPEELTDVNQLPAEFIERVRTYAADSEKSEALDAWLKEKRDASDVVINDMPEGLPYDVDMSKYETEGSSDAEASSDGSDAADAAGDGSGADAQGTDTADGAEAAAGEGEAAGGDAGAAAAGSADAAADAGEAGDAAADAAASSSASASSQPAES